MGFLDPWVEIEEHVRRMQIADPYDRYLQNRANVIADLFASDAHSIDAIALAGISLGALAEARFAADVPPYLRKEKNQLCFRLLLTHHCPSFVNRTSIPEVLRACVRDRQFPRHEENVRDRYAIGDRRAWLASDDPLADDFRSWGDECRPRIPDLLRAFDYAGCIHKYYRNAVVHELRVAGNRDNDDTYGAEGYGPIFYTYPPEDAELLERTGLRPGGDVIARMRFRMHPPYLLGLLREAIASVRDWALQSDRHLFSDEADASGHP
ncbi:MAG: hypothetical protein NVSMB21_12110 [Vulcanimicrobiaceae bacterium]